MADEFRPDRRPWPANVARDVDEELDAHLELRRREFEERGLDSRMAAAAAERKFGNREAVASACQAIDHHARAHQRRKHMLTDLRQDIGYALRSFRRSPGFAAVAILTLALGMGATTTIFTLANWALLRPVAGVTDPARVGIVWVGSYGDRGSFSVSSLAYP